MLIDSTTVQMLSNKVLIKPDLPEEKTSSGLEVVRANDRTPESGVVLAVGPGRATLDGTILPMTVRNGDKVRFVRHGYDEWKDGDVTYLIMDETNILCVLKEITTDNIPF